MKRIGVLSDTHGTVPQQIYSFFKDCDELWHAGDVGRGVLEELRQFKPLRAVYGNIDSGDVRIKFPEVYRWKCEEVDVLMKHIGGYPGKYDASIRKIIYARPPQLFISGHSHLLKVVHDPTIQCLHINPGAAGRYGFHEVRTLVRFTIDGKDIKDLEVIELNDERSGV